MPSTPAIVGLTRVTIGWGCQAALQTIAAGGCGLVLVIRAFAHDLAYDVALRFRDGRPDAILIADADEVDVVAQWRRLAQVLGQPLLIQAVDGSVTAPCEHMGLVQLGHRHDRRRCWALTKRRPFFLRRRKPSRLPERPVVLRGTELAPRR